MQQEIDITSLRDFDEALVARPHSLRGLCVRTSHIQAGNRKHQQGFKLRQERLCRRLICLNPLLHRVVDLRQLEGRWRGIATSGGTGACGPITTGAKPPRLDLVPRPERSRRRVDLGPRRCL